MKKWILILLSPLTVVMGQDYFLTNTGVKTTELNYQAFTHATVPYFGAFFNDTAIQSLMSTGIVDTYSNQELITSLLKLPQRL